MEFTEVIDVVEQHLIKKGIINPQLRKQKVLNASEGNPATKDTGRSNHDHLHHEVAPSTATNGLVPGLPRVMGAFMPSQSSQRPTNSIHDDIGDTIFGRPDACALPTNSICLF